MKNKRSKKSNNVAILLGAVLIGGGAYLYLNQDEKEKYPTSYSTWSDRKVIFESDNTCSNPDWIDPKTCTMTPSQIPLPTPYPTSTSKIDGRLTIV